MKRTSLTTAVIAGIAGVAGISNMASAVYLNNDGLGQVLIYPYYTVNGGNNTLLTVVNTTNQGKAVKVRFLEAYDSREVLDFNLYLSPQDVWTAAVVPVGGGAGVFTNDNSCTVPALPTSLATAQPFLTYAYDGTGDTAADGGPTGVSRTLEGYVELIEMGTVTNASQDTLKSITHSAGVPLDCTQVADAWNGGYWDITAGGDVTIDLSATSGGLFGSGAIINVNQGTIAGYNADAIDQFYSDTFSHHTAPGSLSPNISSATSHVSYVFAPSPTTTSPTLITTSYTSGVDAVSSLFMADKIFNEYWTAGGTAANSEWVITFPTKRFYVDSASAAAGHLQPFDKLFSKGVSCAPIGIGIYDREERTTSGTIGFSPAKSQQGAALCYEAQVVTFNQPGIGTAASAVLGSNLTANIAPPAGANNGWAVIDLYGKSAANHVLPAAYTDGTVGAANVFRGLPVTGFWVANLVNGNVGGVLSNYSALFRHKLHRTCAQASGSACS
ncbi:hypothetical protein [Rudaea cellulosilytica]|jgi:hypothetical protein|uniref:hypothetical protein n=1 Tax=Rudaea cellulosilytica TaxID=540746 RepID=UPI00039A5C4A|nr:hypothetical protein [Rudaea cellulosilytica]